LLAFQLVAAAFAVGVTAWAALQVWPLLAERDRLTEEIAEAEMRVAQLEEEEMKAQEAVLTLEQRAVALREELKGARAATPVLAEAIRAFHAGDYDQAILKYNEALRLDPRNAYIHNLKSYSQFKAADYSGAARTMSSALQLDPAYGWGYFDLARYECAAGAHGAALNTIEAAIKTRGDEIRELLLFFLTEDGEFRRLCADIRGELRNLTQSPDD